jgi:hypothetical protein
MRTTPMPDRAGAVAMATIVSVGENTGTAYTGRLRFAGVCQ